MRASLHLQQPSQGQLVAGLLLLLGVGGFWAWSHPSEPTPETYEAVVFDSSTTVDQSRQCADGRHMLGQILTEAKGNLSISLFRIGSRATDNQPIPLHLMSREREIKLLEQQREDIQRQRLLDEFETVCKKIPPTYESPILPSLMAVVPAMPRKKCERAGNRCRVWVRTDGKEEADPKLIALLTGKTSISEDEPPTPRVDNRNIEIVFCGLSARTRNIPPPDKKTKKPTPINDHYFPEISTVQAAFSREFTHPDLVRFETMCAPFQTDPPHGMPQASAAPSKETRN